MKVFDKVVQSREGKRYFRLLWKATVNRDFELRYHSPWTWFWLKMDLDSLLEKARNAAYDYIWDEMEVIQS